MTQSSFLKVPAPVTGHQTPDSEEGASRLALLASICMIGLALLLSGAAGLINQVLWQRGLKVFLGGSETVCSTVVVLVFMGGLGAGSWWCGRRTSLLRNPLRVFAQVELLLCTVNLAICGLLNAGLSSSVFGVQKAALSLGIPLLAMYSLGAILVLAAPTLLMGITMPLAAEVCQRSLRIKDPGVLGWLLFINTFGSVAGAAVSSTWLLPAWGLSISLIVAVVMNLAAGLLLAGLSVSHPAPSPEDQSRTHQEACRSGFSRESTLAFGLGFCSLAYEMHLFRLFPLKQEPLPFTFAAVLTGFLLFWSVGAALASVSRKFCLGRCLQLCAVGCVLSIAFSAWDSYFHVDGALRLLAFVLLKFHFFLPCVLFGYLFSRVIQTAVQSWGKDVGRLYFANTLGACLGVLLMTFVGFEIPFFVAVVVIGLFLLAMRSLISKPAGEQTQSVNTGRLLLGGGLIASCVCFMTDTSGLLPGSRLFCGRDGVIVVRDNGEMVWDGLWHSSMSDGESHIGTHNWHLGVMPVICRSADTVKDICVIGVGTGITAATLAKLESVERVDAYDISTVLKDVFAAYPDGTLHISRNPRINLIWQDARTGLELNPQKYDIIQTQPLYLKQAGSGLLNSKEFMELVSSRLKPGGVFCLYSNGTPEQAFAIRETADSVFAHRETFFNGYLLILSNTQIRLDADVLTSRLKSDDELWTEIRRHPATATVGHLLALVDAPRLPGGDGRLIITDDRPLIEYPTHLRQEIREHPLPFLLPQPETKYSLHAVKSE